MNNTAGNNSTRPPASGKGHNVRTRCAKRMSGDDGDRPKKRVRVSESASEKRNVSPRQSQSITLEAKGTKRKILDNNEKDQNERKRQRVSRFISGKRNEPKNEEGTKKSQSSTLFEARGKKRKILHDNEKEQSERKRQKVSRIISGKRNESKNEEGTRKRQNRTLEAKGTKRKILENDEKDQTERKRQRVSKFLPGKINEFKNEKGTEKSQSRTQGTKRKILENNEKEQNNRKRQRVAKCIPGKTNESKLKRKILKKYEKKKEERKGKKAFEKVKKHVDSPSSKAVPITPQKKVDETTTTSKETSHQRFEDKYVQGDVLGVGAFGSVFAGYRKADHFPVAVKHISKDNVFYDINRNSRDPDEVLIMKKMNNGSENSAKSAAVALLDYYNLGEELILVMERPVPSMDLQQYVEYNGESLSDEEAKTIMKQLIEAAIELESKSVFHRDIKMENILIETDGLRVRLIDFGLSCFTKKCSTYRIFCGTCMHTPPEFFDNGTYRAGPSTVWQLGVVLYEINNTHCRFDTKGFVTGQLDFCDMSEGCEDMLAMCLNENPKERPTLLELLNHPWLTGNTA